MDERDNKTTAYQINLDAFTLKMEGFFSNDYCVPEEGIHRIQKCAVEVRVRE